MIRYRLALLGVVIGALATAAGCGKPAEAGTAAPDDPWQVLNRDWQVVAGSYGTKPYRPDDLKDWTWTFAGMMRKTDLTWVAAPASDFPTRRTFATAVALREPRLGETLWQIDLADSPFRDPGKSGVFVLRQEGPQWVLKMRFSTDDARFPRPDSVENQKDGYLTVELRAAAP